jgi:alpha-beta hydrolase superfamily lysophospholipase
MNSASSPSYIESKTMKNMLLSFLKIVLLIYVLICIGLYFFQEKLIFFPEKLESVFKFRFNQAFEEVSIQTQDNILLNALLFKADSSKGVIFYLHGNAGSLNSWGEVARIYTDLQYDVFMLDYRGYGKSGGTIKSEEQLYRDVQTAYDKLKTRYEESKIIVLGYSVGTAPATKIASENHPKKLILQAPFYSLTDIKKRYYPIIPSFLLRYQFNNAKHLRACTMPVVIFHGNMDEVIDYRSSLRLKEFMKETDTLITLNGQGHNGMSSNPEYLTNLRKILKD